MKTNKKIIKEIMKKERDKTGVYDIESTTRRMLKDALLIQRKTFLELINKRIEHYDLKLDTKSQVALTQLKRLIPEEKRGRD